MSAGEAGRNHAGVSSPAASLQQQLIAAGQPPLLPDEEERFSLYLRLLLKWNAKMNLTAIRDEEEIIARHFVESIICARMLPSAVKTLLDYGSGAGFPGLPCAICRRDIRVTLAESQGKKALFLREAVRQLGVDALVHHGRVEQMDRRVAFSAVVMRAVDRMKEVAEEASARVEDGGWLLLLTSRRAVEEWRAIPAIAFREPYAMPRSGSRIVLIGQKRLT